MILPISTQKKKEKKEKEKKKVDYINQVCKIRFQALIPISTSKIIYYFTIFCYNFDIATITYTCAPNFFLNTNYYVNKAWNKDSSTFMHCIGYEFQTILQSILQLIDSIFYHTTF